jgi:SAM-dependent methyltransferase
MPWLELIVGIAFVLVLCFGFVLLYGAPYLPTFNKQVETALDLVDLRVGQTLLELGCGDGKVLLAAAARGWNVVGYELNPLLALLAWLRTRRYGKRVKVVCANFWTHSWPEADGIFVFLLGRYMKRLDTKITQSSNGNRPSKPVKLVSFAFQIPDKSASVSRDGIYLYEYGRKN